MNYLGLVSVQEMPGHLLVSVIPGLPAALQQRRTLGGVGVCEWQARECSKPSCVLTMS